MHCKLFQVNSAFFSTLHHTPASLTYPSSIDRSICSVDPHQSARRVPDLAGASSATRQTHFTVPYRELQKRHLNYLLREQETASAYIYVDASHYQHARSRSRGKNNSRRELSVKKLGGTLPLGPWPTCGNIISHSAFLFNLQTRKNQVRCQFGIVNSYPAAV